MRYYILFLCNILQIGQCKIIKYLLKNMCCLFFVGLIKN